MFIEKIIRKLNILMDFFYLLQIKMNSRFKKSKGITHSDSNEFLIVSLTTYHKRLPIVHLTIESILNQSVKPNKLILWLSNEDLTDGKVPVKLTKLESRGLDIRVMDENIRSYKKLIYTLNNYPKSTVITCDDDVIYPKDFIEGLTKKHTDHPDCIVAYRCLVMDKVNQSELSPYFSWCRPQSSDASFALFPTGVGGVLYPPSSLNEIVFDKDIFLELAPKGDDIWFKAMGLLNNIKTITVDTTFTEFPSINGSQDGALWHTNVLENENDTQLKQVFDHFNLYHFIEID